MPFNFSSLGTAFDAGMEMSFLYKNLTLLFISLPLVSLAMAENETSRVGYRRSADGSEVLQKYNGKVRIGREFELTTRPLSLIADLFEMTESNWARSVWSLSEQQLKDYLLDINAFWDLPYGLRQELAQGLKLDDRSLITPGEVDLPPQFQPTNKIVSRGLVDGKGTPINSGGGKQIIIPKMAAQVPQTKEGDIVRPDGSKAQVFHSDWAELNKRWDRLPLSEKKKHVKFMYLSRRVRAELVWGRLGDLSDVGKAEIGSYFAHGFNYSHDGAAIEFRDLVPYQDVTKFYQDAVGFAKRVGILGSVLDPDGTRRADSSFHYHISRIDMEPGESLEPLAKALSRLITIQQLAKGDVDLLLPTTSVQFVRNIWVRGPVRLMSNDRIEIRVHFAALATELDYILKHVTANDLQISYQEVMADVRRSITPKALLNLIGVDHKLNDAQDLLKGTEFLPMLEILKNHEGLSVARYIDKAKEVAASMGLPSSVVDDPKSGFLNGILNSPDAFSPQYDELTVKVFSRVSSDDLPLGLLTEKSRFQEVAKSLALQRYISTLLERDTNLYRATYLICGFGILNEEIIMKLISLLPRINMDHVNQIFSKLKKLEPSDAVVDEMVKSVPRLIDNYRLSQSAAELFVEWMSKSKRAEKFIDDILTEKQSGLATDKIRGIYLDALANHWFEDRLPPKFVRNILELAKSPSLFMATKGFRALINLPGIDGKVLNELTLLLADGNLDLEFRDYAVLLKLWKQASAPDWSGIAKVLVKDLEDSNSQESGILRELITMAPPARGDVKIEGQLRYLLNSPRSHIRKEAALLFANLDLRSPDSIEMLIDHLADVDIDVQDASAKALSSLNWNYPNGKRRLEVLFSNENRWAKEIYLAKASAKKSRCDGLFR